MSYQKKRKHQNSSGHLLRAEWQAWYDSKSPVLLFVLKFGILMGLFYGLLATTYFDQMLYTYLEANAWLSNAILRGLDQPTHVSEVTIQSPGFAIAIRRGCDAIEPTWLFCAAVLSFRAPLSRKLPGILVGIVLLQILNLVRIVTLYLIGLHLPNIFNSAHMEIWPTAFIVVAIALFINWIEWSGKETPTHAVT